MAKETRRLTGIMRRDSERSLLSVAAFTLLTLVACAPLGGQPAVADHAPTLGPDTMARQAGPDLEGPSIVNVRASPPLARPGEIVSLGAVITDPSGVSVAWVRIEGPGVDLNVTLVAFGDAWFLNRSWETPGGYAFEIGAQDGVGNVNAAAGRFQIQESLANTFGLVVLLGTLLAVGAGALVVLWFRRRPTPEA